MRPGLNSLPIHVAMAISHMAGENPVQADGELPDSLQKMLLGLQKYHAHNYTPPESDLEDIWQKNEMTLRTIPEHDYKKDAPVILLVPSLINRSDILNLPDRSLMKWLASQGFNPYLLDWGNSIADPAQQTIDDIVQDCLCSAINFLHKKHKQRIHLLGYCMGGTIALAAVVIAQNKTASLTMLAAPWDFHAGNAALLDRVKFWSPSAFPLIEEKGILSVEWIQTLFASLDPEAAIRKFEKFYDMEEGSEAAKLFVTVEDWLNNGLPLPGKVAQHCICNWYLNNDPARGAWSVDDQIIDPVSLKCPVLIVASDKDRLVECESSTALMDDLPDASWVNPSCGHIGMIAGKNSPDVVWKPIAKWLVEQA